MVEDAIRMLADARAHESKAEDLRKEALCQFRDSFKEELPDELVLDTWNVDGSGFTAKVSFGGLHADLNDAFDEFVTVGAMEISINPILDADAREELEDSWLIDVIAHLEQEMDAVPRERVIDAALEAGHPEMMIRGDLEYLLETGRIYEPKEDHYRTI